jgi:hypothetical protein
MKTNIKSIWGIIINKLFQVILKFSLILCLLTRFLILLISLSHSEHARLTLSNWCVQCCHQGKAQYSAQVVSLHNTVVPKSASRVVSVGVSFVITLDPLFEFERFLSLSSLVFDKGQNLTGLLPTHH